MLEAVTDVLPDCVNQEAVGELVLDVETDTEAVVDHVLEVVGVAVPEMVAVRVVDTL